MENRDEIRCVDQGITSLSAASADIGGVAYHIGRDTHPCSSQYEVAGWGVCSVSVNLPGPPGCLHACLHAGLRPDACGPLSLCCHPLDPEQHAQRNDASRASDAAGSGLNA